MVAIGMAYPHTEIEALAILEGVLEEAGYALDTDEDTDLHRDCVSMTLFPSGVLLNPLEVVLSLSDPGDVERSPRFDVLVFMGRKPRTIEVGVEAGQAILEVLDDIATELGGEFEREAN